VKLLILGATGPTGRQLVEQALAAGHSVAALVRRSTDLAGVEILKGDATDPSAIAGAIRGRDAVLSALGTGKSFKGGGVVSRAAANLVGANVNRLLCVSAFGVGESIDEATLPQKLFFQTLLRGIYADKAKADATIQSSRMEWTIVRPVVLTNGPRTGSYRVGEHLPLRGLPKISRADVADFMIRELNERKWIRKTVVISA
jgi:putative NADH-flavin reductase